MAERKKISDDGEWRRGNWIATRIGKVVVDGQTYETAAAAAAATGISPSALCTALQAGRRRCAGHRIGEGGEEEDADPALANVDVLVAEARRDVGLTQAECAAKVGITVKELREIEHGRAEPSLEVVLALAEILRCDVTRFYRRRRAGPAMRPSKAADIKGRKFGRLKAVKRVGATPSGISIWRCECECGNTRDVRLDHLRSGKTTSCGCGKRRIGERPDVEHGSAAGARSRCTCALCNERRKKMRKRGGDI